jgi:hypothetical protein
LTPLKFARPGLPILEVPIVGDPLLVLEQAGGQRSEYAASDVRQIRHHCPCLRLHLADSSQTDKLEQEPQADQQRGGYEGNAKENAKKTTVRIWSRG